LIRHGQGLGNVNMAAHNHTPYHALPLSDLGHRQASAAGRALANLIKTPPGEPLRIWTSLYQRTRETADRVEEELRSKFPDLDRREHINLCKQQFSLFDGIPDEALPERFPFEYEHYDRAVRHEGKFWVRMPLGESRFDVAVKIHEARHGRTEVSTSTGRPTL
jgi:2,3-bisphosphoglycerate-dependent phosphoglycerate mutase